MKGPLLERVEAQEFYSFTSSGYSRPARIACSRHDGTKVDLYVKFLGAVRNREFGLAAEIVCSLLARELGLHTPVPFIVDISPEFLAGVPTEAQDLVRRSLGFNFGSQTAPEGFSVVPPDPPVPAPLRPVAADVFAFDVIIQNYDRKSDNPNLLWNRKEILMIDFEGALGSVLKSPGPSFSSLELDKFYDHVFYCGLSPGDAKYDQLTEALGRLTPSRLDTLLGEVPASWQIKEDLAKVREHLLWVVEHRQQVCNLIRDRLS